MTTKTLNKKKTTKKTATPEKAEGFISKTPLKTFAPLFKLVEKRNVIPVLACIKAKGGIATATDMDIYLSVPCDLPDGIYLSTGLEFCLKHGEPLVLSEIPLDDFPQLEIKDVVKTPVKFKLSDMDKVQYAMSEEETRYYLNGVNLEVLEDGGYNMICTDGHRLAALSNDARKVTHHGILPRKLVATMLGISNEAEIEGVLMPSKFTAQVGPYSIVAKLIDGTFPDYRRVIPSANDKRVTLKNPLAVVKKEKDRAKAFDKSKPLLKLEIEPEKRVGGKVTEAAVFMGFNAEYVGECAGKADEITFIVSDPASPAIVEGGRAPLAVLMPWRLPVA